MSERSPEFLAEIQAGHPTDAELAALSTVVVALGRRRLETPAPKPRSRWRTARNPAIPGLEAWRSNLHL